LKPWPYIEHLDCVQTLAWVKQSVKAEHPMSIVSSKRT
jgi:hypothetical protein